MDVSDVFEHVHGVIHGDVALSADPRLGVGYLSDLTTLDKIFPAFDDGFVVIRIEA